ncbi:hypothetical protein M5J20_08845 [Corynebacterium sp. TA-R-1]|uniref:Uncharacterized protein n=1 Tax=Corynebacterium stercoris TaxID=2943490 RepID=A0ABT1G2R4_9CORY|nr:hypothetical protein [Corynebacterium stercoris]MCP1388290.1 hypothetical protein [Corynebacterium stercoris]
MKLFLSPFKPAIYLGGFVLLCLVTPLGRLKFGDGGLWTMASAAALCLFFAAGAANWPALNQLGASFNRWMNSAVLTALVAAVVLAPLTAASAVYHQAHSPYYLWYDPFIITNGEPMPWIDGNGEPYFIDGAALDASSIAATVLLHFVIFLTMALVGVAIGLAQGTRMQWLMIGSLFVGAFIGALVIAVTAAGPIVLAASAIVFARTRRFVR